MVALGRTQQGGVALPVPRLQRCADGQQFAHAGRLALRGGGPQLRSRILGRQRPRAHGTQDRNKTSPPEFDDRHCRYPFHESQPPAVQYAGHTRQS
ncbi:hypothetical protein G6F59_018457 [Rhizopus arrhizus]|nr:hypothetical protein G6F59_018457 [Rhizopus arrhizus]